MRCLDLCASSFGGQKRTDGSVNDDLPACVDAEQPAQKGGEIARFAEAKLSPNREDVHYEVQIAYCKAGRATDAIREAKLAGASKNTPTTPSDPLFGREWACFRVADKRSGGFCGGRISTIP